MGKEFNGITANPLHNFIEEFYLQSFSLNFVKLVKSIELITELQCKWLAHPPLNRYTQLYEDLPAR